MAGFKNLLVPILIAGSLAVQDNLRAQDKPSPTGSETKAEVPELTDFHDVIYRLWHTAWPTKDVAMLKELLPEIDKMGGKLVKAQLPGILRERKQKWDSNVSKMESILAAYKTAASGRDSVKLLDAAEQLHAQYEVLVRVVRPALKELEDFHASLYPLYHYYMPQKNLEAIRSAVVQLKDKMAALEKTQLPPKWKGKGQEFADATGSLAKSLKSLDASLSSDDLEEVKKKVEAVHSRYEEVGKIFE